MVTFLKKECFLEGMDNHYAGDVSEDVIQNSKELGFENTYFLGKDFVVITGENQKLVMAQIQQAKQKKLQVFYRPASEEMLRFVLERTLVDGVIGIEFIHPKDSVHHLRSGLDQVLCEIAAQKKKKIIFSFHDVLTAQNRSALLRRMSMNIKLCKKYKLEMVFSTFCESMEELRSAADLKSFWRAIGG